MSYTDRQRFEAAQWFMDIHGAEDPSPELLQNWLRWFESSESNRLAFAAVDQAWHKVPLPAAAIKLNGTVDREEYSGTISIADWLAQKGNQRRNRPRSLAMAAAVAALVVGGAFWGLKHYAGMPSQGGFTTRTGQHRDLALADGSHIDLGARSRLVVNFTPTARDVRLESGEAFFSVRKDPQRPFTVHALGGAITAVGTSFNVRATRERVVVTVTQGAVNVANLPAEKEPAKVVRLHSGEQLIFTAPGRSQAASTISRLTRVDTTQSARWREGWLVYQDEPLRDAIADASRYTNRRITVGESVPRDVRFTGAVFKDSVVEWVEALPEVFPVKVDSKDSAVEVNALPVF